MHFFQKYIFHIQYLYTHYTATSTTIGYKSTTMTTRIKNDHEIRTILFRMRKDLHK